MAKQAQVQNIETIAARPKTRLVALTRIMHGELDKEGALKTISIERDAELPFDPRDSGQAEEHGLEGLVEGKHFALSF